MPSSFPTAIVALVAGLVACTQMATSPDPGVGAEAKPPPPQASLLPTIKIAPARGWPEGVKPSPASGLAVNAFASGLDHPRWLYTLPNGDVLVAETNAQT